jgi:hypothetical protein
LKLYKKKFYSLHKHSQFLKAKIDPTNNDPFNSTEIPFYEFDLDEETAAINISLTRLEGKNGNLILV